ncbi:MAG: tetratricopeptide repeat protein [Acidobacteriota bacterium]
MRLRRDGFPASTRFEDLTEVTKSLHFPLRHLPFIAAVMVLLTLPTLGAVLECRIEIPAGRRLPEHAQIDLRNVSGSQVGSASVQGNGTAIFDRVPAGSYSVSVRAEGFLPVTQDVEIPSGYIGSSLFSVTIRLNPQPQSEGRPRGEKTVSVQSLKVPQEAIDEVELAEKAAAEGSFQEAIEHCKKAVEIYPAYFQAYNNLAVYEYQAGEPAKAVEFFERALVLNPDAVGANLNLGRVLIDRNRPQDAIRYLEHAAKIDPTSSQVQYHLARAYILSASLSQSVKPLQLALELQPPVEHARFLLAHVLYQLGDAPRAVQELELYLKTKPKNERELKQTLKAWKAAAKGQR